MTPDPVLGEYGRCTDAHGQDRSDARNGAGGGAGLVRFRRAGAGAPPPPRGGAFGRPVAVGQGQGGIALDANEHGDFDVMWTRYVSDAKNLMASVKPGGGAFFAAQDVSGLVPDNYISYALDAAIPPAGD